MFLCQRKSISLEQLKEKREKLIKSSEWGVDFIPKMFLIGAVFLIASILSKFAWETLFDALTHSVDFNSYPNAEKAQFVVNMVMYIMPWFFAFISVGLTSVAAIVSLIEVGYYHFGLYTLNKKIKMSAGRNNTNEPQKTQPHHIQYKEGRAVSVLDLHHKSAALAEHANTDYWEFLMCAFGEEAHARGFIALTIDEYQQQFATWKIESLDAQDKSHLGCTVIKARQRLVSPTMATDILDRIVTTGVEDGYHTYWADAILNALEKEGLVVVKTTKTELPHNG